MIEFIKSMVRNWQAKPTTPQGCPTCGHGCYLPIADADGLHQCAACGQPVIIIEHHALPKGSILESDDGPEPFIRTMRRAR